MTIDMRSRSRSLRGAATTAALTTGLVLGPFAGTAVAAPPTGWEDPQNGSTLDALLLLVGLPLLIIAGITLLTYLPAMVNRGPAEPGVAFRDRSEWFGGPRAGAEAAEASEEPAAGETGRGGASGRW